MIESELAEIFETVGGQGWLAAGDADIGLDRDALLARVRPSASLDRDALLARVGPSASERDGGGARSGRLGGRRTTPFNHPYGATG